MLITKTFLISQLYFMKKYRTLLIVLALFIAQVLVINHLLNHLIINDSSSYHYFFKWFSHTQRVLFRKIPFSVGDVFYALVALYIFYNFIKCVKNLKKNTIPFVIKFLSLAIILEFCFYVFWGFNYARIPLRDTLHLNIKNIKVEDLIALNKALIFKVNKLQFELTQSDSIKVSAPYNKNEILIKSSNSYSQLAKKWPIFKNNTPSLKYSMYSLPLSYMGYSGYYNPFTGEAQVNSKIVKPYIPFTACHELAHQIGYAAEQEANFLGYLACIYSKDSFVQYSGYLVALSYSLSNLRKVNKSQYQILVNEINKGVLKNYKENYTFWKAHQNPSTKIFESIYDGFLKANKQAKGIKSYYGIVKLIIAYHKVYPLKKS